jgi:histidinol-phosphate aminotransferase
LPLQPKKWLAGLEVCPHGGIDYAELEELGIDPDRILDFSVSTNPFMPPPGIKERLKDMPVERYPDSWASALTQKLAARLVVDAENIVVGSGTTEIIRLIALAYFRRGDAILIPQPTYGEYELAGRITGARIMAPRAAEEANFTPKIDEVIKTIRQRRPRAVFICNPNNPTGKYLSRMAIERIADALDDTLLVLDEAYVAFVASSWCPFDLAERGNVIVLRSMTKDYGLPGLRLGYAVARRGIADVLRKVRPPWNVNGLAQATGLAVLDEDDYLQQSLAQVKEAKRFLTAEIARFGFTVLPSDAHYFLVKVGNAPECRRALLRHGILVRDGSSFGLPEYIRVSPRSLPECEKLVAAMEKTLSEIP